MGSFPVIDKRMGLSCGGLVAYQICSNDSYCTRSISLDQIRVDLGLDKHTRTDLVRLTTFFLEHGCNVFFHVKEHIFGTSGLSSDVARLLNSSLTSKKKIYLQQLQQLISTHRCVICSDITTNHLDTIFRTGGVCVVVVDSDLFSKGKYDGQHIALLVGMDSATYHVQGKRLFKIEKELLVSAMKHVKVPSFIEVKRI